MTQDFLLAAKALLTSYVLRFSPTKVVPTLMCSRGMVSAGRVTGPTIALILTAVSALYLFISFFLLFVYFMSD